MTVVVHDQRVTDLLRVEPWPRSAERTQADGDVEQTIRMCPDGRERRDDVVDGKAGRFLLRGATRETQRT